MTTPIKILNKHEIEIEAKKYGDVIPSCTHVCVGCLADIGEVRENTKPVSHSPTTDFSTLHTHTNTHTNMDLNTDTYTNTNTEHTRQHFWCVWSCQKWRGLFSTVLWIYNSQFISTLMNFLFHFWDDQKVLTNTCL